MDIGGLNLGRLWRLSFGFDLIDEIFHGISQKGPFIGRALGFGSFGSYFLEIVIFLARQGSGAIFIIFSEHVPE